MGIPAHILPKIDRPYDQDRCEPLESACAEVVRERMIASNVVAIVVLLMPANCLLRPGIDRAR